MAKEDKEKLPTLQIHKCSQELIDRVNAKAALVGKGKDSWVRELLERETKGLVEIQGEYRKEDAELNKSAEEDGDPKPSPTQHR